MTRRRKHKPKAYRDLPKLEKETEKVEEKPKVNEPREEEKKSTALSPEKKRPKFDWQDYRRKMSNLLQKCKGNPLE